MVDRRPSSILISEAQLQTRVAEMAAQIRAEYPDNVHIIAVLKGAFKTPTVREAANTGPYFHDGSAKSLMEETMKIAAKIAEKSMLTAMLVKEAVGRAQETSLSEGLLVERRLFHAAFATEDQKEGMAAFLEKRQPQFRDR